MVKGYDEVISEFTDTFAATPTLSTLKMLIAIAISKGYHIYLGDISVAFLHAPVIQTIYVMPPPDYESEIHVPQGDRVIWKLLKALYGLKTAPKSWQIHIVSVLKDLEFKQSKADPCFFHKGQVYLIIYVDDLFITGLDHQEIQNVITALKKQVLLRDVGWLTEGTKLNYLGRDLYRSGMSIYMSTPIQPIVDLIEFYKLSGSRSVQTTGSVTTDKFQELSDISPSSQEPEDNGSDTTTAQDLTDFRSAVGKLQWLTGTRPDIQYAVKELAREVSDLKPSSIVKLKHLLRYLKGTINYVIEFRQFVSQAPSALSEIHVYCDANWAGCQRTRRSTSGYVIFYLNNVIHSASKTQHSVALSSAESELYAICSAVSEAIHLSNVITETEITEKSVTIHVHSDSQSAIAISARTGPGKKSKHIQIRFLFVQDMVQTGHVKLHKVHTGSNCSDRQTKFIGKDKISKFTADQRVTTIPE